MKRLSILVLVIAAAYCGSSWYFGKHIEGMVDAQYARAQELNPQLRIVDRSYQRGIFSSEETATVEVPLPAGANAPADNPFAAEALRLRVHTNIQHGPLPGLSTLAMGKIQAEILLPDGAPKTLIDALHGRPPLSIQSIVGFDGNTHSTFSSPELKLEFTDNKGETAHIAWQGMHGVGDASADMKHVTGNVEIPALLITGGKGEKVAFNGVHVVMDQSQMFDDGPSFPIGSQRVDIDRITLDIPDGANPAVELQQVGYGYDIHKSGDNLFDTVVRFGIAGIQIGEDRLGPLHLDLALKHLNARAATEMTQAIRNVYADPALMAGEQALVQQMLIVLMQHAPEVLGNAPELRIERVSLATDKGSIQLTGQAHLQDADPGKSMMADPVVLLGRLDATADLQLNEEMVFNLLRNPPGMKQAVANKTAEATIAQFQQQVAAFEKMGYVTRDGGNLKTNARFSGGQLQINGKPFMPMGEPSLQQD
jgi:uncharacterized protein YdgA (DUF945 family)